MKKFLSILFATLFALVPSATFALDYKTPEVNVPNYAEILNNIKEKERGTQRYGFDSKESQECAQALLEYPKFNYLITDYDLTIDITEDNRYKVTEDYDVCYATTGSHGIYRDIPTSKDFWRENGDVTKDVKMQVTNVKVSGDNYEKSRENNNIHLKIGNANRTLNRGDSKHYTITYEYNFGPDRLNGVDEFYYNIIGSEWATDVVFLNTDFEINFPKDVEENKIGFTHGYTKDSLSGGTPFELKNNKSIQGHYYDSLKGGEALTIRVTLPEGYIQGAAYDTNEKALKIFMAFSAIILIPIILLFFIYGKDEKLNLYTRNDPPEGMNPVQFGSLVNASSSTNVTSLFYFLAEQGYLQIEETDKNKYDIIILKDYDGKDEASRVFMQCLKSYDKDDNNRISISSLRDHFYTKIPQIEKAANIKELNDKVYTKSGNIYRSLTLTALILYLIIGAIFLITDPYADESALIVLLLFAFFIIPGAAVSISGLKSLLKGENAFAGIFLLVFGGLFIYVPLQILLIAEDIQLDSAQIIGMITIAVTSVIIAICIANGKKYTEEGKKIMTDVMSYYNTIKRCRPDAEHGFSYFYYTFAFAFAAGLSTAFSKKFKEVISEPPEWYHGTHGFDHFDTRSFAHSMGSISSSSSSSPSSSGSGGGSSGGGSSGGGGGGGGGGGW